MSAEPSRRRRVGINALFLDAQMGGLETYVRRLVPALLEVDPRLEISLFLNSGGRRALESEPWLGEVSVVGHPALGVRGARAAAELSVLGWLASRARVDVLHSVALTAPLLWRGRSVITIADVTWLRQPDEADRFTHLIWKTFVPVLARGAARVITISEAAKWEISVDLGVPAGDIDVTPLGPGSSDATPTLEGELRGRLGLGEGAVVLAVSATKVHKNLAPLIEAMVDVRARHPGAVLVVPGNPTPLRASLEARARELGVADALRFPGWVSPGDLEGLYACAAVFAFPSLREGFGLPVLEAMRRGVPVACSNTSAVPEVAGDGALLFDPYSRDEIAGAILRVLGDPDLAERLRAAGLERQAQFTWRRTAEGTIESYERALVGR